MWPETGPQFYFVFLDVLHLITTIAFFPKVCYYTLVRRDKKKRKEVTIMETISYALERRDTPNFHGWIILERNEGLDTEIFSSTSLEEARTFLNDLIA